MANDRGLSVITAELEKLASRIPFINPIDVVYHRIPYQARDLMDDQERAAFKAFMDLADKADESRLWILTAHINARIRTLALIGVYWQGNPKRLPGLVDLIDDRAETFPAVADVSQMGPNWFETPTQRRRTVGEIKQTVGDIAKSIVRKHLDVASPSDDRRPLTENFRDYWAARSNRTHCLSWFQLALSRATRSATPHPECIPALLKLRKQVDALEPPYRSWILLALRAPPPFASSEDFVRAEREIGRPALMDLFHGKLKSDDPDIRIDPNNPYEPFRYRDVCERILSNAAEVFRPEDADTLLALEQFHRERRARNSSVAPVSPRWAIAAADLAPKRARVILLAAFERFKDAHDAWEESMLPNMRCELAQAFWKHEGMAGVDVAKNWFFNEVPNPNCYGSGRHKLANWLGDDGNRRPLLKAIVFDDRLNNLDLTSLDYLIRAIYPNWHNTGVREAEAIQILRSVLK
ncbi:MAG: hypothetical protein NTY01_20970 [Verrucomicrobia bacterium]|nr:hypothetical protein [Verrucomicrobiota bacterium]